MFIVLINLITEFCPQNEGLEVSSNCKSRTQFRCNECNQGYCDEHSTRICQNCYTKKFSWMNFSVWMCKVNVLLRFVPFLSVTLWVIERKKYERKIFPTSNFAVWVLDSLVSFPFEPKSLRSPHSRVIGTWKQNRP